MPYLMPACTHTPPPGYAPARRPLAATGPTTLPETGTAPFPTSLVPPCLHTVWMCGKPLPRLCCPRRHYTLAPGRCRLPVPVGTFRAGLQALGHCRDARPHLLPMPCPVHGSHTPCHATLGTMPACHPCQHCHAHSACAALARSCPHACYACQHACNSSHVHYHIRKKEETAYSRGATSERMDAVGCPVADISSFGC